MSGIQDVLDILRGKYGGRRDFWYSHATFVGSFITENSIKPSMPFGGPAMQQQSAMGGTEARLLWPWGFAGGIRIPHLHYNGEFYAVNEAQWGKFTKSVITSVTEKLQKTQRLGFDQLMDVADSVHTL